MIDTVVLLRFMCKRVLMFDTLERSIWEEFGTLEYRALRGAVQAPKPFLRFSASPLAPGRDKAFLQCQRRLALGRGLSYITFEIFNVDRVPTNPRRCKGISVFFFGYYTRNIPQKIVLFEVCQDRQGRYRRLRMPLSEVAQTEPPRIKHPV